MGEMLRECFYSSDLELLCGAPVGGRERGKGPSGGGEGSGSDEESSDEEGGAECRGCFRPRFCFLDDFRAPVDGLGGARAGVHAAQRYDGRALEACDLVLCLGTDLRDARVQGLLRRVDPKVKRVFGVIVCVLAWFPCWLGFRDFWFRDS
jgi:hypothetical protein